MKTSKCYQSGLFLPMGNQLLNIYQHTTGLFLHLNLNKRGTQKLALEHENTFNIHFFPLAYLYSTLMDTILVSLISLSKSLIKNTKYQS